MEDLVRINFDIWSSLLVFGVFQGVFLVFILLSYRRNASVYFLISLLLIIVFNMANYLLLSTHLYSEFPHLLHLSTPLLFLQGPFYYWYIRSIMGHEKQKRWLWHLIPFFIAVVVMLPFYLLTGEQKVLEFRVYEDQGAITLSLTSFVFMVLQIFHCLAYIYVANRQLKKQSEIKDSRQAKNKMRWLQRFGQLFLIYWVIDFLALAWYSLKGEIFHEVFYIIMLCNTVLINVLVFFAIKNNKEFSQILLNNWNERYKNSSLAASDSKQYLRMIIEFVESERAYLDTDLSLSKLARQLDMSSHQISQVLNLELERNFYEFLNEYRFKEARHRLLQPENKHLTILAIAFDSGFNNKNTFNKVFKKHEGLTPSQFMRQHQ